jgi:hypothetical protein
LAAIGSRQKSSHSTSCFHTASATPCPLSRKRSGTPPTYSR